MFEFVGVVLAVCLALAVGCALFGDEEHSKRGRAVLRELLRVRRSGSGDEGER
ncbi:hypothetical protein ACIBL3_23610 [Kribbella sp. NPDC050124]|uniref:hypothetical protein n=1 Tax=Kribbella sp. NPDC050124 TaxID=3364114 RepID=UPI0037BCD1D7